MMEIDFCFVIECTSSMGSYIEAAKDCIKKVEDCMATMKPGVTIRVVTVTTVMALTVCRFSCDEFKNYITANVTAGGGGDSPKDVLGGLNAAINGATMSASFFMSPMLHHMVVFTLVCPTTIREAIRKV